MRVLFVRFLHDLLSQRAVSFLFAVGGAWMRGGVFSLFDERKRGERSAFPARSRHSDFSPSAIFRGSFFATDRGKVRLFVGAIRGNERALFPARSGGVGTANPESEARFIFRVRNLFRVRASSARSDQCDGRGGVCRRTLPCRRRRENLLRHIDPSRRADFPILFPVRPSANGVYGLEKGGVFRRRDLFGVLLFGDRIFQSGRKTLSRSRICRDFVILSLYFSRTLSQTPPRESTFRRQAGKE